MTSERRMLLALVLSMSFFYFWFEFVVPKPQPSKPSATPTPVASVAAAPTAAASPTVKAAAPSQPAIPVAVRKATSPLFDMNWTNQGGTIEHAELKKYHQAAQKNSAPVSVVPFREKVPPPLRWQWNFDNVTVSDEGAVYREVNATDTSITYERPLADRVTLRKTFNWKEDSYSLFCDVQILNSRDLTLRVNASTVLSSGIQEPKHRRMLGEQGDPVHAAAYINEKSYRWVHEQVLKNPEIPQGDIQWAGFDSRYFFLGAVPQEGRWSSIGVSSPEGSSQIDLTLNYPPRDVPPKGEISYHLKFYAGPKDIGILRSEGGALDRAIDLGDWLGPIARPILDFLRWLYSKIPNYGVAIILLTVLVRLLMFPLTHIQAKSFRKMQKHKPEMDAIREKYKDNKEAQTRETMNYMRKHRINPMGGCLLILPQMPVFFALYRVLYNSIELRHAPFALWITDLAAHDPYFVTPVLLGIVMFLQQKLTPTPGVDPAQQSMMKIMPVMFSALMLLLPSGLVLYIFVSTLWGVLQQYWVQKGATQTATTA